MRICSYNIHGGKNAAGAPSLPAIADALRAVNADVVLLQEVDRFLPRSGYRDQSQILATALNCSAVHWGRLRFMWSAFGNAVLTRQDRRGVQRIALPASGGEPRCALEVECADGTMVYSVHLGLRDDWRAQQLSALGDHLASHSEPSVVGGDFNAFLDEPAIQTFLKDAGLVAVSKDAPTFPAAAPSARIDFLFARGFTRAAAGSESPSCSDHCLIWADLQPEIP